MSLLTDEELKQAREVWVKEDAGDTYTHCVLSTQHTKTLKAVAEWGNATCFNGLHSEENIIAVRQIECPDCQDDLLEAAAKGKMPGEE